MLIKMSLSALCCAWVFAGVYHAGFNHGFNAAESTNFATRRWEGQGACVLMRLSLNESSSRALHKSLQSARESLGERWGFYETTRLLTVVVPVIGFVQSKLHQSRGG